MVATLWFRRTSYTCTTPPELAVARSPFGAQATAYQLTGGQLNLVPLLIGRQMSGDVLHNTGLGFALAMGMVAIMGVTILVYLWLQKRAERWYR